MPSARYNPEPGTSEGRSNLGSVDLEDGPQPADTRRTTQPFDTLGSGGDDDSLLIVNSRTGSRVPLVLALSQLVLGLFGALFGICEIAVTSSLSTNHGNSTTVTAALNEFNTFGFPLWCSLSMILSSVFGILYNRSSLQKLLVLYRRYTLFNVTMYTIGLVVFVASASWVASVKNLALLSRETTAQKSFHTINTLILISAWLYVLASVIADYCVGKNICKVCQIFINICRQNRLSFNEVKLSSNSSLNRAADSFEHSRITFERRGNQRNHNAASSDDDDNVSRDFMLPPEPRHVVA